MQLPFTIVVEAPSRTEIERLARGWWARAVAGTLLAAVIAGLVLFSFSTRPQAEPEVGGATLRVSSVPEAATVAIDGRVRGRTPTDLLLTPGEYRLTVGHEHSIEATYQVRLEAGQTTCIAAELWLRNPRVQQMRPPFPGVTIVGANFLRDGRVALAVALPPGDERQLWLVDGDGGIHRLGPSSARGSLVTSANGEQVAYLAASQSSDISTRLNEVWIAPHDGEPGARRYTLPANAAGERFVDLGWAPDAQYLLLVTRQQLPGGGQRTHLRRLPIDGGEPRDLMSLPSEIVSGSYNWSPDGERVAFLTRTGQTTSLCLLDTRGGEFRYLADLARGDTSPLPFAPLTWSPDGRRLLYTAPAQDRPVDGGWLFGPKTTIGVFAVDLAHPIGQRLTAAEGQFPVWRSDGSAIVLARPSGGPLVLRQVESSGETHDPSAGSGQVLAELSLKAPSRFAVRWDVAHAQALVVLPAPASLGPSQPEYWLIRFRPEVDQ